MIVNTALVRWAGGWAERADTDASDTDGRIEGLLGLGAIGSIAEVNRVADAQLAEFAHEREQTDIGIDTTDVTELPYVGNIAVGDTVDVDGDNHRVLGFTVAENDKTGRATVTPTLNDAIVLGPWERLAQAVGKMSPGTFGGRSKVAQPVVHPYTPRGLAPPAVLGFGAAAWWKFNDAGSLTVVTGKVTVAEDKTGNGNDMLDGHGTGGSGPDWGSTTLNGKRTADFDAGGFMHLAAAGALGFLDEATVYMVVNMEDVGSVGVQSLLEVQSNFGCDLNLGYYSATENAPDPPEFRLSGGCGSGTTDGPTLAGAGTGGYLVRLTLTGASTAEVYVGGEGTQAYSRGIAATGAINRFVFGYPFPAGMQIAEAFVFPEQAPAVDTAVRAYLASEWAVTA